MTQAPTSRGALAVAGDVAGLGERHAPVGARVGAAIGGHLSPDGIHEQLAATHVERAEIGIGLAAQRLQRRRALAAAEVRQRRDQAADIAAGGNRVERAADRLLVHGLADRAEGVGAEQQGEIDV